MNYTNALLILFCGLLFITIIDTAGAIASRKLNFKYARLSVLSFAVYIGVGYLVSKQYGFDTALFINALLGTYDATIGLRLSYILKANNGVDPDQRLKPLSIKAVVFMIGVAGIFTTLGYAFSRV